MLDLTGYKLTFDDEFNSLSISQGTGTVWSDIRPGSRLSPYADIGFGDSAFVDPGSGINPFSLQNWALDITADGGPWDIGTVHTGTNFYGGSPGQDNYLQVWSNQPSMTTGYHTYGVMWTPQYITFYFDGIETGQLPTPPDMHQPMYLLADLAMQALSEVTSDPKHFNIDYIRVYSNDPNATAVPLQTISSPDGADTGGLYGATYGIASTKIQSDYLAITQQSLPADQANSVANSINSGAQTEFQYVSSLIAQATDGTIPAIAVEATMYGVVGTSTEITTLATQYLPPQIANAIQHGFNPIVYASEALGLAFAFANESGSTTFADSFGPANATLPNSVAGDTAFASTAASAIFGGASTTTLVNAIAGYVANWKSFYTTYGLLGNSASTAPDIDLAARGAAWGDAVGLALADNLGPIKSETTNFVMDAAEGLANYSTPLVGQPAHHLFQGEV
jgi:hypothetical protein